ncbi:MAG TPA: hypothetical protein VJK52_04605 [Candidatus Nanoarchaeia archaeon]|nr:hypothetical protein [Candidatus Nanoarchaeia archaeon]
MSTGPNQPQPQNSPELQRELEQMWGRVLQTDPTTSRLTAETRKIINESLGATRLDKILEETGSKRSLLEIRRQPVIQAHVMQRICREMAETRAGLFHHIHGHDPKIKATRGVRHAAPDPVAVAHLASVRAALENPPDPAAVAYLASVGRAAGKDPTEQEIEDAQAPRYQLGDLINDPDSKEADALYWLFEQLANDGNVHTLIPIFERVKEIETKDAGVLVKMQALSKEIISDKEYFNIGEEGTVNQTMGTAGVAGTKKIKGDAPTPTEYTLAGGSGALKRLQEQMIMWRNDAALEAIRDKGDPKPAREEAAKYDVKIEQLNAKKRTLQTKLTQINTFARQLSSPPAAWVKANIEDWSKTFTPDFFENTVADYATTDIELGDKTRPISEWLAEEELGTTQARITRRFRMAGEGQPPASLVLDDLIRTYFGARLIGTPQAEQDQFYNNMRTTLLSAEHGHGGAGPANAPSAHGSTHSSGAGTGAHGTSAKKPGINWMEMFFGK